MPVPPYPYTPSPSAGPYPPRTWSANDFVTVPRLRGDVGNAITLLANRPAFSGVQEAAQSIPNSSFTLVNLDTELWDPWQQHSTSQDPQYYYLVNGLPGWWLATGCAALNFTTANKTFQTAVSLTHGGVQTNYVGATVNTTNIWNLCTVAKLIPMSVAGLIGGTGDAVSLTAWHDAGTAQSLVATSGNYPRLSTRWLGIGDTAPWTGVTAPSLTTAPSPITSAWLNTNVRDTIRALTWPPFMEWSMATASGSLASQTAQPTVGTTVALDTATIDGHSLYNSGTHTATIPTGWGGQWYAYGQVGVGGSATQAALAAGITVTSSHYNSGTQITLWGQCQGPNTDSGVTQCSNVQRRLRLSAGDTVTLAGFQNSGGARNYIAGRSWMILVWEGL